MRKTSVKRANELYRGMTIRYCYPYCVCLDPENHAVAFQNREYHFMCDYPNNGEVFWYELDKNVFDSFSGYLEKAIPKEEDKANEGRFRKYWLYNDGNAPMYKASCYNRYRKLLDNILLYTASSRLNSILRTGEMGFDWGKKHDGVLFKKDKEEKAVNLHDAAREEAERYILR